MTAVVLRGDAARLPLPDASVDLIVTSPPYFGLRSYSDGGGHYDGQVGSEASPREYLEALAACTREWVRVLKPSGSIFVNLGDKFSSTGGAQRQGENGQMADRAITEARRRNIGEKAMREDAGLRRSGDWGIPNKSLIGLPWRYALACMDDLGLILRRDIIWHKPNGLPESVTDRCRSSHEYLFHMTKLPRYFAAVDEIREPHAPASLSRYQYSDAGHQGDWLTLGLGRAQQGQHTKTNPLGNPLGKLPGSVWSIDEDRSLLRSILRAVADGHLTPEEGERLWTGRSDSGRVSIAPTTTHAGSGAAGETRRATASSTCHGQPISGEHIVSPTSSSSGPSVMASPLTTSAATEDASTPPTWSLSPSRKTSDVGQSQIPASTDMGSLPTTPTSEAGETGNAGCACGTGHAGAGQESAEPPSVWTIPSAPLKVPASLGIDHFAAFPPELCRRIILGWSPPGVCTACGEGRRPVSERVTGLRLDGRKRPARDNARNWSESACCDNKWGGDRIWDRGVGALITGYACACPQPDAPTRPAVVLDPFGGTGTTALVAAAYGRTGVTVDRSADYCRLARWRCSDPGERARALGVPKPPPVPDGQGSLFDDEEAV